MDIWIRDGYADIFGDAYVGYSAILSDNAEVDADIRIHSARPSLVITMVHVSMMHEECMILDR